MIRGLFSLFGYELSRRRGAQNPGPERYSSPAADPVTWDTAMQLSAWWAGTRLLSEVVASLPIHFWEEDRRGNRITLSNDVTEVLQGKPNRYQTRYEFMETMMLNLVTRGNAYAIKQYVGTRLVGLLPIMSAQVETELLPDGTVVHHYYHDTGVTTYSAQSLWHLKLFGNGVVGLSPLAYARNSLGIAQAGENRTGQIFRNGGKPSGVLMIDKLLNKQQREQIKEKFRELREGNEDRLMVLEANMKYERISMSPEDIQLLESRRFSLEDLARFLGVPSVLINDTSGSTTWGSGVQQIIQGFYKLNLRPYFTRIESSIIDNLMPEADRRRAHCAFDFDALTKLDRAQRAEANQKEINSATATPNELRREEGLPPIDGGDQLFINSTLIPLSQAGQPRNTSGGKQ